MLRPYLNIWGKLKGGKGNRFGAFCDIGDIEYGDNFTVECHVSISPGWKFGNNVFVGPGARFANDKHPRVGMPWEPLPGVVEDDVCIGMGAMIGPGVRIGKGATIGFGAVVTKDVPAGETWVGNPARAISKSATPKI